jgi:hypothetical protein
VATRGAKRPRAGSTWTRPGWIRWAGSLYVRGVVNTEQPSFDHLAVARLEPGETVDSLARAMNASILVTDRRVAIAEADRVALDIPYHGLRRIQFDIERQRPSTLVIVLERPSDEPQVMAVPPERYDEVTRALALIGKRLSDQ